MEISIRQDSVLDALVTYQVTGSISDDHIDAAIEALQQYQSIEDKNRQLRWALEAILPQIEKIQRGANQPDLARKIEAAHLALQGDKMTQYGTGDRVVLKKHILSYLDGPLDPQPGARGTVVWADDILEVEFDGYSVYGVREYMLRKLTSEEIIQEITARAEASSEGDWEASVNSDGELIITLEDPEQTAIIWCGDMETCTGKDLNNHKFIAQARKDILFLLQYIKNQHD